MAIAGGATTEANCAPDGMISRETPRGWTNLRPIEREAAGAVGQWVDLLASISHEMRTPLNAVIGFSDAMQQEVFGPIGNARYQEYVQHIRASGVELLKAAEDALAMTAVLAQPRNVALEDVPLLPLVEQAVEEIAGPDRLGRSMVRVRVPEGLEVRGDRRILPRAIRQLIAVAASRAVPGSVVDVAARVEHGLVDLIVEVAMPAADAAPIVLAVPHAGELGLGRRELAMWLALALLDQLDCRLLVETSGSVMQLKTTLEQSIQTSFFAGSSASLA